LAYKKQVKRKYLEGKVGQIGSIGFLNDNVELRPPFAFLDGANVSTSFVDLTGRPVEANHLISNRVNAIG
jgi:hypothetical protein